MYTTWAKRILCQSIKLTMSCRHVCVKKASLDKSAGAEATCHISKTSVGEYEMRILEVSITLEAFLTYWEGKLCAAFAFLTWLKCF